MINVVVLNGGRGASSIIPVLLNKQGLNVTSIVNAYDDGKSTGEIRKFFGMLGPSDIRKVQEFMLPKDDVDYLSNLELFEYRFPLDARHDETLIKLQNFTDGVSENLIDINISDPNVKKMLKVFVSEFLLGLEIIESLNGERFNFSDCSIMNCLYAGAFLTCNRNIEQATILIDRLFKLRGTVLPTNIENKKLVAQRENGDMLYSEAEIVELRSNVRIDKIYLLDKGLEKGKFDLLSNSKKQYYLERHNCYVGISSTVKLALQQADIIIYAAGTQHSSLYPTYISTGLSQAIADNHLAYKALIVNIGADYETPSYKVSDYIHGAYHYLNLSDKRTYSMKELFDVILVNKSDINANEAYVKCDYDKMDDISTPLIVDNFESLRHKGKHDGDKIIATILGLFGDKFTKK